MLMMIKIMNDNNNDNDDNKNKYDDNKKQNLDHNDAVGWLFGSLP